MKRLIIIFLFFVSIVNINPQENINNIRQMFIGNWLQQIDSVSVLQFYHFNQNGRYNSSFMETAYFEEGTWDIINGKLIINQESLYIESFEDLERQIFEYEFIFININLLRIILNINGVLYYDKIFNRIN